MHIGAKIWSDFQANNQTYVHLYVLKIRLVHLHIQWIFQYWSCQRLPFFKYAKVSKSLHSVNLKHIGEDKVGTQTTMGNVKSLERWMKVFLNEEGRSRIWTGPGWEGRLCKGGWEKVFPGGGKQHARRENMECWAVCGTVPLWWQSTIWQRTPEGTAFLCGSAKFSSAHSLRKTMPSGKIKMWAYTLYWNGTTVTCLEKY